MIFNNSPQKFDIVLHPSYLNFTKGLPKNLEIDATACFMVVSLKIIIGIYIIRCSTDGGLSYFEKIMLLSMNQLKHLRPLIGDLMLPQASWAVLKSLLMM